MPEQSPLSRLLTWGLTLFFRALYHSFAWSYDWVAAIVSLGRWKSWVLSVLPQLPGRRVLEIGHGPGHLQIALANQQIAVFGIDQSRQMGRIAQRRMRTLGYDSRLVNGIGQSLPFCDDTFNQVVATFPTPFIIEKQTLEDIFRVLIPGGTLIVLPVAWITGSSPADRIAARVFHLLGQAPDGDDINLQPFLETSFTATVERRKLPTSEVLVIVAVKRKVERVSTI
jgi:ubiquinone/menaquinone biosynthesis C-methylase UbiE